MEKDYKYERERGSIHLRPEGQSLLEQGDKE